MYPLIVNQRNITTNFSVVQVTAMTKDFIEVDNFPYPPSLILLPNQILNWEIKEMMQVKPEHLKIVEILNPPPTYVIIGCERPQ